MKKIVILLASVIFPVLVTAQAPEKMSYQAVIRDASNELISNQAIGIRISILQGSESGIPIYIETQTPTTNDNGLVTIIIGDGTTTDNFSAIDWSTGPYFLKTETDPTGGTSYTITGVSQLLSVPYALYAKLSENVVNLQITPNILIGPGAGENTPDDREVIAIGNSALYNNGIGATESSHANYNTAIGWEALYSNTTGTDNTANGYHALRSNTTGQGNTAYGVSTLDSNTTGSYNTANGLMALSCNTTGRYNTANGNTALYSNTKGVYNTAIGDRALYANTTGNRNTANGHKALYSNITGYYNTANGYKALYSNSTGRYNTANGDRALYSNITGKANTANGHLALYSNTTGKYNTAIGTSALYSNITGRSNTANGHWALYSNTKGDHNTAIGTSALYSDTSGEYNTAIGTSALYSNTIGNYNTAIGMSALYSNTIGNYNTAIGKSALYSNESGEYNTAIGKGALNTNKSGSYNIALGYAAGVSIEGSNNIAIGYKANIPYSSKSNQIRLGNTDITNAYIQVKWSYASDIKWKESIRELPYGLSFVNKLKPVDYIRKNNENRTREAGFIAQDVEALLKELGIENSGLVSKGYEGSLELRYSDFIPVLTKAMQEQQTIIDELKTRIEALENK
jgi:hypothetical protein